MNNRQENSMSHAYALLNFCENNIAALTAASVRFADWFAEYKALLQETETHDGEANEVKTGWAVQKKLIRGIFTDIFLTVANAWEGYYIFIKDTKTAGLAKYTLSKLVRMRDAIILFKGNKLAKKCTPALTSIPSFGANADMITALKTAASNFEDVIDEGPDRRIIASSFIKQLKVDFKAIAEHLKQLDFIVKGVRFTNKTFYASYIEVRKKTDNAATHGKPYKTIIIPPNSYYEGAMFPFLISRIFRVVNKSGEIIFWGLSNSANEYTGTKRFLGSKSSSMVRSKTLGIDGDILLFQNPTNNPVTVDIWLRE